MGACVLNGPCSSYFLGASALRHQNIKTKYIIEQLPLFCCGAFDSETVDIIRCFKTISFHDGNTTLFSDHILYASQPATSHAL